MADETRPWIDPVALRTKGRVTTYSNGQVRDYVDKVALRTKGRVTTYAPGEKTSNVTYTTLYTMVYNDSRLTFNLTGRVSVE